MPHDMDNRKRSLKFYKFECNARQKLGDEEGGQKYKLYMKKGQKRINNANQPPLNM
jgi:hypothetical protein